MWNEPTSKVANFISNFEKKQCDIKNGFDQDQLLDSSYLQKSKQNVSITSDPDLRSDDFEGLNLVTQFCSQMRKTSPAAITTLNESTRSNHFRV